ncbi:zinc finger CCCH domain-containing protein 2 [Prosopis cineraria]|uniref:zinc finger CCCH domain-containing protein 2 n=1 Tax=Prosopis cineraria TaxID=364024 RepID=UPI00240FC94B|nr:zinc finger CCCH domain-containing protein 2 [Prosopis cineraria]
MSSVCADQHKFHPFSPKKSLLDIPPRKLLTRRSAAAAAAIHDPDMFPDSPCFSSSDEAFLRKFLPRNNLNADSDSDDSDLYSSDHFRMYEFKVRRCTRSRSHDWTDCPFAHPGEKARRRDPRRYHYSGTVCPEYRRGGCSRGDGCEFAHGVFECWLHPARYRTEACKDGKNCKRKVCFFAHTPRQLRILPVNSHSHSSSSADHHASCKNHNKFMNPASGSKNCCLFCHHCSAGSTSSPTSTLFGMSHMSPPLSPSSSPVSPPLSPVKLRSTANGLSPISRYCDRLPGCETSSRLVNNQGVVSYKEALTELMSSLEGLNFMEANASPVSATKSQNLPWLDMSSINCEDQQQQFILSPATSFSCEDQQQQFILSPSAHTPTTTSVSSSFSNGKLYANSTFLSSENRVVSNDNGSVCSAPDLGWVNDLLM